MFHFQSISFSLALSAFSSILAYSGLYCFILFSSISWCITLLQVTTTKAIHNTSSKNNVNFCISRRMDERTKKPHTQRFAQLHHHIINSTFSIFSPNRFILHRKHAIARAHFTCRSIESKAATLHSIKTLSIMWLYKEKSCIFVIRKYNSFPLSGFVAIKIGNIRPETKLTSQQSDSVWEESNEFHHHDDEQLEYR